MWRTLRDFPKSNPAPVVPEDDPSEERGFPFSRTPLPSPLLKPASQDAYENKLIKVEANSIFTGLQTLMTIFEKLSSF